jgi:hypothetical protein
LQPPCSARAACLAIVVTMNILTSNAGHLIAQQTINDRIRQAEARAQVRALRAERRAERARHADTIQSVSAPSKTWTTWFARLAH